MVRYVANHGYCVWCSALLLSNVWFWFPCMGTVVVDSWVKSVKDNLDRMDDRVLPMNRFIQRLALFNIATYFYSITLLLYIGDAVLKQAMFFFPYTCDFLLQWSNYLWVWIITQWNKLPGVG